jgi:lipoate-protein ligase A
MKYYAVPKGSPAFHQAFEQVVFEEIREDDVLLLWDNEPAIVCGAYQNIYQETSIYRAQKQGIDVIRRISGGGTVYHDPGNLNYTILTDHQSGIDYDSMMADIIEALNQMGIPAAKNRVCDIAIHGKKISGSAQKIVKGRLMHHGTLLFDADLSVLREVADRTGRTYHSKAIPSNPAEVVNIRKYWNGTMEEFQKALLAAYPADFTEESLSEDQMERVRQLAAEKYQSWEWNCGRSPAFSCEISGVLKGTDIPVDLRYEAKKGIITVCELTSPALPKDAQDALTGAKLEPKSIEKICRALTDQSEALADFIL